jgi:sigma-B regulation protein RsbU (phosphoserine phosphatase)
VTDTPDLTDFLDVDTLQEIQDRFAAVTGVRTSIRNAADETLTRPSPAAEGEPPDAGDGPIVEAYYAAAPISLDGRRLGSIVMEDRPRPASPSPAIRDLAHQFGLSDEQLMQLLTQVRQSAIDRYNASLEFLHLLANTIARLCFHEHQLRRRVEELSAMYDIARELVAQPDLQSLLNSVTRLVSEVMMVKAASLRLLDPERRELRMKSVYNLSAEYLNKGPVMYGASVIDRVALDGQAVYVADLANDPRVLYPDEMKREGLASALVIGLIYQNRPVGVLRVYTGVPHEFSEYEVSMLHAVANQAAAAIVNAELRIEMRQAEATQRQVEVARDVQRRMIPEQAPAVRGFELAGLYTPAYDLGGDFYDFVELPDGRVGIAIADVVGKGIAASLMMASVRSSLRAYAFRYRDLNELMHYVNQDLCRDTLGNEFTTAFYGELDPNLRRMYYVNAGHNPPLHRSAGGKFRELDVGGTVLGAFEDATFEVGEIEFGTGSD